MPLLASEDGLRTFTCLWTGCQALEDATSPKTGPDHVLYIVAKQWMLDNYRVGDLPNVFYIPDYISKEEEERLLERVSSCKAPWTEVICNDLRTLHECLHQLLDMHESQEIFWSCFAKTAGQRETTEELRGQGP